MASHLIRNNAFCMNSVLKTLRRSASGQNFQTGLPLNGLGPQPQPEVVYSRSGLENAPPEISILITKPPNRPRATAAMALPMANGQPRAAAVINRVGGSIRGEETQNAMTAESGAPSASSPAMKGMTSHEQKAASPPNRAAST